MTNTATGHDIKFSLQSRDGDCVRDCIAKTAKATWSSTNSNLIRSEYGGKVECMLLDVCRKHIMSGKGSC